MRIDSAVARRKFASEVTKLHQQRDVLRSWGAWLARAEYPLVDVVFVPRKTMKLTAPIPQLSIIVSAQPSLGTLELPVLAARAFGVRLSLDDYDQRAPALTFHDPWTWDLLPPDRIPLGQTVDEHGKAQLVVLNDHPETRRPFLCIRGTREYHEHPQHTGDDWAMYRGDAGLFSLLSTVWRTCVDLARPHLVLVRPGDVRLQWEAEAPRSQA